MIEALVGANVVVLGWEAWQFVRPRGGPTVWGFSTYDVDLTDWATAVRAGQRRALEELTELRDVIDQTDAVPNLSEFWFQLTVLQPGEKIPSLEELTSEAREEP